MAVLAVTNTFSSGTTISSSQMNTNFSDIVNWLNNRYNGSDTWSFVKVSSTDANPVDIASSAATTEVSINNTATDGDPILTFKLSGTTAFVLGVDDSDSDYLKIAGASGIGSSDLFILTGAGSIAAGPNPAVSGRAHFRTNAAEDFRFQISVNNATGDPYVNLSTNSTEWSFGSDNSDSDNLKISQSSAIGTTDRFIMNTAGSIAAGPNPVLSGRAHFRTSAAEDFRFQITVDNASGDPYVNFSTNATEWSVGADNSDSDALVISESSTIGTNNRFRIGAGGVFSMLGSGLQMGAPTGGDKGSGTINVATDIYKNNTAYTNPDYVLEKWANGTIELFKSNEGALQYPGLLPLAHLEDHMRTNLDLPGVKERFRDSQGAQGIFARSDVALEKIEEAFIYITELHNRVSKLEIN